MLTLDEEKNLPRALAGLAGWASDVVVLDSGSRDATVEIARAAGARVVEHAFEGHARQWLWGMREIPLENEWVFMHDPDHVVLPELKAELTELFARGVPPGVDGLYVRRRNVFRGRWIRHGGYYPKYMLKIVRRSVVQFDEREFDYRAYVPGRTLALAHDIVEENVKEEDITFWIDKHNRFACRQAEEELFRATHPESWKTTPSLLGTPDQRTLRLKILWYRLPLYLRPFLYFAYRYVLRLGFLDGKEGALFHFLQGFWYRLIVDVKLEELRRAAAASPSVEAGSRNGTRAVS